MPRGPRCESYFKAWRKSYPHALDHSCFGNRKRSFTNHRVILEASHASRPKLRELLNGWRKSYSSLVHQLLWGLNFKAPQNEPPNNIGGCIVLDDRSVRVTKRMTKVAPCELVDIHRHQPFLQSEKTQMKSMLQILFVEQKKTTWNPALKWWLTL